MARSVDAILTAAADALADGDGHAALERALEAWRATKRAEIAEVVRPIAATLEAREPPLDAGNETSQGRRWAARAAERRPASLGLLLADVVDQGPHVARGRLEALAAWPPDPRITRALVGWLERPPFRGSGRARFFPTLLGLLEAQKDPAALPALDRLLADRTAAVRRVGLRQVASLEAIRDALATVPVADDLGAGARAAIARIEEALGRARATPKKKLVADLLADVYAAPDDDGPRLVYADALAEAGDPRGELIVLQCERARTGGAPTRRERELLRSYERAWLGAIERVVKKAGVRYERGFAAACRYETAGETNVDDAPEWSTVVEIDVLPQSSYAIGSANLLLQPHLRALRRVWGMKIEDLTRVGAHDRPLAWDAISIKLWSARVGALLGAVAEVETLPSLRELGLVNEAIDERAIASLLRAPLARGLSRFEARVAPDRVAAARSACDGGPASLTRVDLCCDGATLSFARGRDGDALTITIEAASDRAVQAAATALGTLAKGAVASLSVVAGVGRIEGGAVHYGRWARASLGAITAAAKRLGVAPASA